MAGAVPCDAALCVSYLEEIMANIKEIEALTNAFGPSGFEDEVIREVKNLSLIHISEPTRPY